jgi:phosphatidylserine/phosphatidylglycerophosphate/cardiolipin synthase-like enzyme
MQPTKEQGDQSAPEPSIAKAIPKRKIFRRIFLVLLLACIGVGVFQTWKPLPANVSMEGEDYQIAGTNVEFLADITAMRGGQKVIQQTLYNRALGMISGAQDFVLLDLFLFNDYMGKATNAHRKLCKEVTDALIEKKASQPKIHMVVITDPLNEIYGGAEAGHLKRLRDAGIPVVLTDLRQLRDSNPAYSSLWRIFVQWFGNSAGCWMPHPFAAEAGKVSLRSWLTLLNFKANHRKLVVADTVGGAAGRQMTSLVMSANPHDASSAHNNVGLFVRGGVWKDLLRGEQAILTFSGQSMDLFSLLPTYATNSVAITNASNAKVRVVTESKIRKNLLEVLGGAGKGDSIDIGMFYLSERSIINALLAAAKRGAAVRVLLDPNRDAFGYEKNGIPNRPVAGELAGNGNITVRWYNTHGEQFHSKMVIVKHRNTATLMTGSANFTKRNIGDYNLETDLMVTGTTDLPAIQAAQYYFDRIWANQGLECSVGYDAFADASTWHYWKYRFQEWSGLSTF